MLCLLCGGRKARRACPALGGQICTVCCATKRLKEIDCPSDCSYLTSAREHPSAALIRQQQQDLGVFLPLVRDFNERQSELFILAATLLRTYRGSALESLLDDDAIEALGALAATLETASRGVIYEHRPASAPAARLAAALRTALSEGDRTGGSSFERDAAVVLRRLETAAIQTRAQQGTRRRAFLELLSRVFTKDREQTPTPDTPRLIVP